MMKEILFWQGTCNHPIENTRKRFPPKPEEAKTVWAWLKEGYRPIHLYRARIYAMPSDISKGYQYFLPVDVVRMSLAEKQEYQQYMEQKKTSQKKETTSVKKKEQQKPQQKVGLQIPDYSKMEGKRILAFDTETTGFSPSYEELLQLSIAGNQGEEYDFYIKPRYHKSWKKAMEVNHITPEMVENAPYAEELRDRVQELFDSADYLVGYNINFDVQFLKQKMGIHIDPEKVIDCMPIMKADTPQLPKHRLGDAIQYYCDPEIYEEYCKGSHNSLYDAKATLSVFLAQIEYHLREEEKER